MTSPSWVALTLSMVLVALTGCGRSSQQSIRESAAGTPQIELILTGLENPRGVAIGPNGELFVAEAGTGRYSADPASGDGKFTRFTDINDDGDFNDTGEAERWFSHLPSYNALKVYDTGRDEVGGPVDVLLHRDGRIFLSVDDGGFGEMALHEISPAKSVGRSLAGRNNMNGITFNLGQDKIFAVESGFNTLIEIPLEGELREIVILPPLDSGQQAVPAGLTLDPRTGDVLVALFSGRVQDNETGETIPFVDGDAKIVRVDTETGQLTDEITDLTTAVDVAMDEAGNIIVVELAATSTDLLPSTFDLFDPHAPLVHGGYLRFSGRVTLFPSKGGPPRVLATGLDAPTNVTIGPDGSLYISTGQGTPGRLIPGPDGPTMIVGEVIRITNYLSEIENP